MLARARGWWSSRRTNLEPAAVLSMWWCAALLAHYDNRAHWAISPEAAASVVAAAVGMLVARSALVVAAVAALQLGAMWRLFPGVDNHWAFAGFVDLAILGATVTWAVRRRMRGQPIGPLDDDWYGLIAPLVRLLVIAMYAFAVFHKLNLGFLMWSNLVVTDETNHLLVSGDAIRVFDYTSDVVRVRSSSDAKLAAWATSRSVVAWWTFRAEAQRAVARARRAAKPVQVTYERGGMLSRVPDAGLDATLMEQGSYLERKLVKVKPVPHHRPARCEW